VGQFKLEQGQGAPALGHASSGTYASGAARGIGMRDLAFQ
jgi:hypothetical protein